MPLDLLLTPTSTGKILESTYANIEANRVPTTHLSTLHPFHTLWREHLASLRHPGLSDAVIDAFISLTKGNPKWRSRRDLTTEQLINNRREIRAFLKEHAPDVVIVSNCSSEYSFHLRKQSFFHLIFISEHYVNLWMNTEEEEKRLGLTVLLKASIDHEIGHWFFTLKVGTVSDDEVSSPREKEQIHTPKKLSAVWNDEGEAGDYVEVCSRGGIIGYSKQFGQAFIDTGDVEKRTLPLDYLKVYDSQHQIDNPSLYFTPTSTPSHATRRKAVPDQFFPRIHNPESDQCAGQSSSSSESFENRRPHCAQRMRDHRRLLELLSKQNEGPPV